MGLKVLVHGHDYDWGKALPETSATGEYLHGLYSQMKELKLFDMYEQQEIRLAMEKIPQAEWTLSKLPPNVKAKMELAMNLASASDPEKLISAIKEKVVKKITDQMKEENASEEAPEAELVQYLSKFDFKKIIGVYMSPGILCTRQYEEPKGFLDGGTVGHDCAVRGSSNVTFVTDEKYWDAGHSFSGNTFKGWWKHKMGGNSVNMTIVFSRDRTLVTYAHLERIDIDSPYQIKSVLVRSSHQSRCERLQVA